LIIGSIAAVVVLLTSDFDAKEFLHFCIILGLQQWSPLYEKINKFDKCVQRSVSFIPE